jgi:hypothetical protein
MEQSITRTFNAVKDTAFGCYIVESYEPCSTGEYGFKHYVTIESGVYTPPLELMEAQYDEQQRGKRQTDFTFG